jgi:hypothetical protein
MTETSVIRRIRRSVSLYGETRHLREHGKPVPLIQNKRIGALADPFAILGRTGYLHGFFSVAERLGREGFSPCLDRNSGAVSGFELLAESSSAVQVFYSNGRMACQS